MPKMIMPSKDKSINFLLQQPFYSNAFMKRTCPYYYNKQWNFIWLTYRTRNKWYVVKYGSFCFCFVINENLINQNSVRSSRHRCAWPKLALLFTILLFLCVLYLIINNIRISPSRILASVIRYSALMWCWSIKLPSYSLSVKTNMSLSTVQHNGKRPSLVNWLNSKFHCCGC